MVTFAELVSTEMKRQGISRSELARKIGYERITKGLRRLDTFVATLVGPEDFPEQLKNALGVSDEVFNAAARETHQYLIQKERESFRPSIQVTVDQPPSPVFAMALLLNIGVPKRLPEMPEEKQMDVVRFLYRKHSFKGKGFVYYRSYDESYEFDMEGKLLKHNTHHVDPRFIFSFRI